MHDRNKKRTIHPSPMSPDVEGSNLPGLLADRELGPGTPISINKKIGLQVGLPETPNTVATNFDRGYLGRHCGESYVSAWQGSRCICLHDLDGYAVTKTIYCRSLRWTITDLDLTPDNRFLLYSSITPLVHLVSVDSPGEQSVANVTDIHERLIFQEEEEDYGEGIWAVRWSPDSQREILAGSSSSVYLYDLPTQTVVARLMHHRDDINSVEYADCSGTIFFSGSDDANINVYDKRTCGLGRGKPVGSFVGHLNGITHLNSKGDGRLLLSNSKDQKAKVWDLRMGLVSYAEAKQERRVGDVPRIGFDYRWQKWPSRCRHMSHPRDRSLVSFHGHEVLQTLIRAYWSPLFSTNQAYVYAGSACGSVFIWDALRGGEPIHKLSGHDDVVRDVSWDPYHPAITSISFDGKVVAWSN
jgi:WD repeat-containing protein 23